MLSIYKFPYDTNLHYLPLAYLLPSDLLEGCPTLRKLPRSMGGLNASPAWAEAIQSDAFLKEIMDAAVSLAFPNFGFGGWKEHYTGYFPVWRLSYSLPLWAKGWNRRQAGACNRCSVCRLTLKYPSSTRSMCGRCLKRWWDRPSRNRAGGPRWKRYGKCPVMRISSRGTPTPGKISSASGITRAPKRFRRFRWKN